MTALAERNLEGRFTSKFGKRIYNRFPMSDLTSVVVI